jgi:hypothetical protein
MITIAAKAIHRLYPRAAIEENHDEGARASGTFTIGQVFDLSRSGTALGHAFFCFATTMPEP